MPTGYTAPIEHGISFEQFTMNCARNFGALIHMRDEPMSADIPKEVIPSDYHLVQTNILKERLEQLKLMDPSAAQEAVDKLFSDNEAYRLKKLAEITSLRQKYDEMLLNIKAWNPPSDDHVELKKFMISQVCSGIEYDCDDSYYQKITIKQDAKVWHETEIAKTNAEIKRNQAQYTDEVKRASSKTLWLTQLVNSFEPVKI